MAYTHKSPPLIIVGAGFMPFWGKPNITTPGENSFNHSQSLDVMLCGFDVSTFMSRPSEALMQGDLVMQTKSPNMSLSTPGMKT